MQTAPESKKRRSLGRTPLDLPLVFFLLSAFIGLWAAYDRDLSWPLLQILLGSIGLYLALTWSGLGATGLRRLAWVLLLLQSALALYYISQFNHLDYPVKIEFVSRLGRLTGGVFPAWGDFYPHRNAVATFIEGGAPLAGGLWLSARGRWERLAAGLVFLLLGYGLLLTASRGAWVAVATCAGLAAVAWSAGRFSHDRRVVGLLTLAMLALLIGAGLVLMSPGRVPGLPSAMARGEDRAELYKNSLHLARDYPLLGIGLGDTFALIYSKYILLTPFAYLTYSHNLFLAVWLNQGLLGLVSFGWMLIAFYGHGVRHVRRGQATPLFWGAILGVTAMLLHGLTDVPQYAESRWIMPVLYALLGLGIAAARQSPGDYRQSPGDRRQLAPRRVALVALLIVALGLTGAFLLTDDFYANLGALRQARADLAPGLDDAARQRALDQAAHQYERALDINGKQPVAHWRLGLIALNADRFAEAIEHLEIAWTALPGHRGVRKALGLAYLWDGQIERAEKLLRPLDEMIAELDAWTYWRGEQGQDQLAEYARQLRFRLSDDP